MEDKASLAIRRRMRELGLSQPALGKKLGKSHSWVNMYLLEKPAETIRKLWAKNPEEINKLLHALQWTPEDFIRETGIELPGLQPTPLERMGAEPVSMAQVPLVGVVSAGRGNSEAGFMGFVEVPSDLVRRFRDRLYALQVDGDSMFCEDLPYSIPPGAYVVVSPDLDPQPGDLVVAWDEENEVGYLKEYRPRRDGYQVLRSWNPEVPPIVVQDGDRVQIRGVVVYVSYSPREVRPWGRVRR